MWQRHNAQLANFEVTSLRVAASATTQQLDVRVIRSESLRIETASPLARG
jgi:hypothetical protein